MWKGGDGFSVGRWGFWKKGFGDVVVLETTEKVKRLAGEAAVEMEKIECVLEGLRALKRELFGDETQECSTSQLLCSTPWYRQQEST